MEARASAAPRFVSFACALACAFAATPAVGVARAEAGSPRVEVHERSLGLVVRVEASNGYDGWIETEGHRRVTLSLRKGGTEIEARTTGRVSRHGIEATFGDMGRISVRFRGRPVDLPSSARRDGERRCRGREPVLESGRFIGKIEFRGENGFTELDWKRARGFVIRKYRRVCKPHPKGLAAFRKVFERLFSAMPVTALRARDRVSGTNFLYQAAAIDFSSLFGSGFVLFAHSAQAMEHADGIRLTRKVAAEGGRRSFRFPRGRRAPRTATVTAPKPFTGSAEYSKQRGTPASWTGPLAARLPGIGLVAMAGPGFKAAACKLTLGALLDGRCLPASGQVVTRALSLLDRGFAQGSGSQSQFFWDDRLPWSR